jgi:hypothetical protein
MPTSKDARPKQQGPARPDLGRDKVSNGRLLPPGVDLRSAGARRYRYLVSSYSDEIGTDPTESERALIRQAASLQLRIEQLQVRVVRGEDVSADEIIRLSSEHRRLLSLLQGKADSAKPAAPAAIDQYLKDKYGAPAEAEDEEAEV